MHIANTMVLVAAILPLATVGAAKAGGGYDNAKPRDFLARLDGLRARANWAHANHFEAFAPFAAAVILAQMNAAPQAQVDLLAEVFIAFRLAYTVAYLVNQATVRTLLWAGAFGCTIKLFLLAT